MTIKVELKNVDRLGVFLRRIEEAAKPEGALDEIGAVLLNRTRKRFLATQDPDGKPWIESAAARARANKGRGGKTLFDTGTLFHSIQLSRRGPLERALETDVPYAPDHQKGTRRLPQRQFLGFSDADQDIMVKILEARLRKVV